MILNSPTKSILMFLKTNILSIYKVGALGSREMLFRRAVCEAFRTPNVGERRNGVALSENCLCTLPMSHVVEYPKQAFVVSAG